MRVLIHTKASSACLSLVLQSCCCSIVSLLLQSWFSCYHCSNADMWHKELVVLCNYSPTATNQKSVHICIHSPVKNRTLSYLWIHIPRWWHYKTKKGKEGKDSVRKHFHSTTLTSLQLQIKVITGTKSQPQRSAQGFPQRTRGQAEQKGRWF